jgi:DNA invertase Pin-like site-specific DNA recombinase
MAKHVALYLRISEDKTGLAEGVEAQERLGRAYAAETWPGVPVVVYSDNDLTAADDTVYREHFERLRADIAAGKVVHLWSVEQTRLCRTYAWFTFATELERAGITHVHTRRDGVVPVADLASDVNAVVAIHEVRRLKQRLRDKQDDAAALGRPPGGCRFGYRNVVSQDGRKALEVVPQEAAVIREVATRLLAGEAKTRVARELAAKGTVGRRGSPITAAGLHSWFRGGTVAGLRQHRGEFIRDKVTGELVRGQWEPILDVETWQAVRAKLDVNAGKGKGKGKRSAALKYMLSGIAWCPDCETHMVGSVARRSGRKDARRLICKGCNVTIDAQAVEDHVAARLLDRLDFLADRLAYDANAGRRAEIVAELATVEERRKMARRMLAKGTMAEEDFPEFRAELDDIERQLTRQLAELPSAVASIDPMAVRRAWSVGTADERRTLAAKFIDRVVITRAKPGTSRRTVDLGRVTIAGPGWGDEAAENAA